MKPAALLVLGLSLLAPRAQAQTTTPVPDGFPAVGQLPIITVLSAGSEPRRPLRYHVAPDYRGHLDMDMTMSIGMRMDGQSMPPIDMPTIRTGAELVVTSVSPEGDITYTMAYTGMSAPDANAPMPPASLDAMNAEIRKVTGTVRVSSRGIVSTFDLDASAITNPQTRQLMDSLRNSASGLSVALPEDALGIGARWQTRTAANLTMTLFQTMECELIALDATTATIRTTLKQTAPAQPVVNPALPPEAQMSLESMTGEGGATMQIVFSSLVPESEGTAKTTANMVVSIAGATQRLTVESTMKMKVAHSQ